MNFNHVSERISIRSIMEFLAHGDYAVEQSKEKNYEERVKEAGKKIEAFCEKHFAEGTKRAEAEEALFEIVAEHEGIAFEIGSLFSLKLITEAQEKMETLPL